MQEADCKVGLFPNTNLMHKYSIAVDFSPGSFDSRLFNYIEKNNSSWYSSAVVIDKAVDRLSSKSFYNDGIAYIGAFFNWLFTRERVGKDLAKRYKDWLQSLAKRTLFCIGEEAIPANDIWLLIITPIKNEVHIVRPDRKHIYPIFYHDFPTKKVVANDISKLHIRISDIVNRKISEKKNELKALPDLMNVFNHILPDIGMNTSINKKNELKKALDTLSAEDDDYKLLSSMAEDLLTDMNLIFSDIEIYWG